MTLSLNTGDCTQPGEDWDLRYQDSTKPVRKNTKMTLKPICHCYRMIDLTLSLDCLVIYAHEENHAYSLKVLSPVMQV